MELILQFNIVFFLGCVSGMIYYVPTKHFVTSCGAVMFFLGGAILIHVGTPDICSSGESRRLHCTYRRIFRCQHHLCLSLDFSPFYEKTLHVKVIYGPHI